MVPKATLADWIWGERPPAEAANALQRLVSRLRKALPEGLVERQPGGYRFEAEVSLGRGAEIAAELTDGPVPTAWLPGRQRPRQGHPLLIAQILVRQPRSRNR
jgi:DNA-binding winged helix-turn-helix (wHTH) protein